MSVKEEQDKIVKEFSELEEWDDKYSLLIKMGKDLGELDPEIKVDKNKISGCQSQVWMHAKLDDGKMQIFGDSDAMIVKGLVALLIKVYSNQKPEVILSSPPNFLNEIGIDKHLSPTRKNGLGAMLKQIQLFALAFKALAKKE
ncbi:MAG: SufE family protein [Ignavibacteriae bacterium]|nr:SufE family protein [Ignavibacteriota bacterium]MCB9258243.1 SufE family protein [Ignavibacteriales bacterium]